METHHLQLHPNTRSSLSKSPKGRGEQRETKTRSNEDQEEDDVDFQSSNDEQDIQSRARDQEESFVRKCQSTVIKISRYEVVLQILAKNSGSVRPSAKFPVAEYAAAEP